MADHAFFVWVGNGPALQFIHRGERFLQGRLHRIDKRAIDPRAAQIDRQPDGRKFGVELFKAIPKLFVGEFHMPLSSGKTVFLTKELAPAQLYLPIRHRRDSVRMKIAPSSRAGEASARSPRSFFA